jgi:hypothetical protein
MLVAAAAGIEPDRHSLPIESGQRENPQFDRARTTNHRFEENVVAISCRDASVGSDQPVLGGIGLVVS